MENCVRVERTRCLLGMSNISPFRRAETRLSNSASLSVAERPDLDDVEKEVEKRQKFYEN